MSDWNAAQYAKFKAQRTLPAAELANALPAQGVESIIDLGCGIGNSTAVLKNRFRRLILSARTAPTICSTSRGKTSRNSSL